MEKEIEEASDESSGLTDGYVESSAFDLFTASFTYLRSSPRELWLLYMIKFCLTGSSYTFLTCISIFLSEVHGISDLSMSIVFVLMSVTSVAMIAALAHFPDRFGIKISLLIGGLLNILQYTILITFENFYIQAIAFILISGISLGFYIGALEVGVKFYTSPKFRTLAISFSIAVMNLSLMCGGGIIEIMLMQGDQTQETFKILFGYCIAISIFASGLSLGLRNIDYEHRKEEEIESNMILGSTAWGHTREILVRKTFWRLFALSSLILVIKTIFYQQAVVLPLYMTRDLGTDDYYGFFVAGNQVLIIILLPLCTYAIYFYSAYDIFLISSLIAVVSPLIFLIGPTYSSIAIYTILTSISESLMAPIIVQYSLNIAPQGKESVLLALSFLPFVFSLLVTGITGSILLNSFCPEDGEKNCWAMWLIIFAYTAPALLLMFFCRKWLEEPTFEHNPYVSCSKEAKLT